PAAAAVCGTSVAGKKRLMTRSKKKPPKSPPTIGATTVTTSDQPCRIPGKAILPNPYSHRKILGPRSRAGFSEVIVCGAVTNTSITTPKPSAIGKNQGAGAFTLRRSRSTRMNTTSSAVAIASVKKPRHTGTSAHAFGPTPTIQGCGEIGMSIIASFSLPAPPIVRWFASANRWNELENIVIRAAAPTRAPTRRREGDGHRGVDVRPRHRSRHVDGQGDRQSPRHAGTEQVADAAEQDGFEDDAASEKDQDEVADGLAQVPADPSFLLHASPPWIGDGAPRGLPRGAPSVGGSRNEHPTPDDLAGGQVLHRLPGLLHRVLHGADGHLPLTVQLHQFLQLGVAADDAADHVPLHRDHVQRRGGDDPAISDDDV